MRTLCFSLSRVRWLARASRWPILALLILSPMACSKTKPEPAWVSFNSPAGKFSVMMPSKPDEKIAKTPNGEEGHTFSIVSSMSNVRAMSIGYIDQPSAVQGGAEKLLDSARDSAVKGLDGKLLREKPVTLGSFPGREIEFALPKGNVVVQRIFLAHNRQYTAIVITTAAKSSGPEVDRFFNSFKID